MANNNLTVDCTSVEELLKNLATEAKDKAVRAALRAGAKVEQAAIQANCPERIDDTTSGTALPPGALKADVVIKGSNKKTDVPYATVGFGKYTKHVARFVEDGHKIIHSSHGKKTDTGKETRPNPFVSRAFESSEQAVKEAIQETFITNITKAAKGK